MRASAVSRLRLRSLPWATCGRRGLLTQARAKGPLEVRESLSRYSEGETFTLTMSHSATIT